MPCRYPAKDFEQVETGEVRVLRDTAIDTLSAQPIRLSLSLQVLFSVRLSATCGALRLAVGRRKPRLAGPEAPTGQGLLPTAVVTGAERHATAGYPASPISLCTG